MSTSTTPSSTKSNRGKNSNKKKLNLDALFQRVFERLDTIEENQRQRKDFNNESFDLDEALKQAEAKSPIIKERRSTLLQGEINQDINSNISNIIQIPQCAAELRDLTPRNVIKFIAEVQTYQISYNTTANLSRAFNSRSEVALTIIAASEGQYTATNIGTITLDNFVMIVKQHLRVHTQARFITQMRKYTWFPASNIKKINQHTFGEFRSHLKQYCNDFLMLIDLFAYDDSVVPPISTNSQNGLIHVFNQKVPFNYAAGIYKQIGFNGANKKHFNTMDDYLILFNNKIDELYKLTNMVQPLYDAALDPTKLPHEKVPWKAKENPPTPQLKQAQEDDNKSRCSDLTTTDTTNPEVKAIFGNKRDRSQMPCHSFALNNECTRENCPYSHDKVIIQTYKDNLKAKLT